MVKWREGFIAQSVPIYSLGSAAVWGLRLHTGWTQCVTAACPGTSLGMGLCRRGFQSPGKAGRYPWHDEQRSEAAGLLNSSELTNMNQQICSYCKAPLGIQQSFCSHHPESSGWASTADQALARNASCGAAYSTWRAYTKFSFKRGTAKKPPPLNPNCLCTQYKRQVQKDQVK